MPYASGASADADVRVVGGQFYWSLSQETFERGETVRFDVTSADVNHGFGLYDPDGRLIGSVQAMPGYHNKLTVTLEKAGPYTIACFEYCGLAHHGMIRRFEVRP
jgi:cytochrome c oxidase subunit 2